MKATRQARRQATKLHWPCDGDCLWGHQRAITNPSCLSCRVMEHAAPLQLALLGTVHPTPRAALECCFSIAYCSPALDWDQESPCWTHLLSGKTLLQLSCCRGSGGPVSCSCLPSSMDSGLCLLELPLGSAAGTDIRLGTYDGRCAPSGKAFLVCQALTDPLRCTIRQLVQSNSCWHHTIGSGSKSEHSLLPMCSASPVTLAEQVAPQRSQAADVGHERFLHGGLLLPLFEGQFVVQAVLGLPALGCSYLLPWLLRCLSCL